MRNSRRAGISEIFSQSHGMVCVPPLLCKRYTNSYSKVEKPLRSSMEARSGWWSFLLNRSRSTVTVRLSEFRCSSNSEFRRNPSSCRVYSLFDLSFHGFWWGYSVQNSPSDFRFLVLVDLRRNYSAQKALTSNHPSQQHTTICIWWMCVCFLAKCKHSISCSTLVGNFLTLQCFRNDLV